MLLLEIIMVIVGVGAVVLSFRFADAADNKSKKGADTEVNAPKEISNTEKIFFNAAQNDVAGGLTDEEKERILEGQREQLQEIAAEISYDTEDRLGSMSSEKIAEFSQYSDRILDKMEKNHAETVFLYDMLNEKEKEIKKLVHEADVARSNLHDELLKEYQERKGYGTVEKDNPLDIAFHDDFRKDIYDSVDTGKEPVNDKAVNMNVNFGGTDEGMLGGADADEDILSMDRISLYDAEIAKIEHDEKLSMMNNDTVVEEMGEHIFNRPVDMNSSKNDIISMYKDGKSILEISKVLSVGQGEVKLVIDMYRARKG